MLNGLIPVTETLENGNCLVHYSTTGLCHAAEYGRAETVQALLVLGANADIRNSVGQTALMCAAHGGHNSVLDQLLEAWQAPKTQGDGQANRLSMVARERWTELTVMDCACVHRLSGTVELLREWGCPFAERPAER